MAEQATNNSLFDQQSKKATAQLNQSGAQKSIELTNSTKALNDKREHLKAEEQAKQEYRAGQIEKRNNQRQHMASNATGEETPGLFDSVTNVANGVVEAFTEGWDALDVATTKGGKATVKAAKKAGKAFADNPEIYGTTAAAIVMPAIVATTVLGGKEVLGVVKCPIDDGQSSRG
ncbi:hypothetical protein D0S45_20410 [Marinifilum sp. JC120]|nr:hypothetical protein D0S45_20410 [Marinifilum sp. JC120]